MHTKVPVCTFFLSRICGGLIFVANVAYPFGEQVPQAQLDFAAHMVEPEQEYTPHPQRIYTSSITVQAPTNFKPQKVDNAPAPKPAPPAVPPKPFRDTDVFKAVDLHAVEVSKEEHKNFKDLVWHLIYARDITNELEKARYRHFSCLSAFMILSAVLALQSYLPVAVFQGPHPIGFH
jgi:hypothetical protein